MGDLYGFHVNLSWCNSHCHARCKTITKKSPQNANYKAIIAMPIHLKSPQTQIPMAKRCVFLMRLLNPEKPHHLRSTNSLYPSQKERIVFKTIHFQVLNWSISGRAYISPRTTMETQFLFHQIFASAALAHSRASI